MEVSPSEFFYVVSSQPLVQPRDEERDKSLEDKPHGFAQLIEKSKDGSTELFIHFGFGEKEKVRSHPDEIERFLRDNQYHTPVTLVTNLPVKPHQGYGKLPDFCLKCMRIKDPVRVGKLADPIILNPGYCSRQEECLSCQ
jgi:hypothetical protein